MFSAAFAAEYTEVISPKLGASSSDARLVPRYTIFLCWPRRTSGRKARTVWMGATTSRWSSSEKSLSSLGVN